MATNQSRGSVGSDDVRFCERYGKFLHAGRLTFEEYAERLTTILLDTPAEYLPLCLDTVSPDALDRYAEHLRDLLIPVDFMPHPFIFFTHQNTEAERERIRQLRRPRYVAIYEAVLGRLPKP